MVKCTKCLTSKAEAEFYPAPASQAHRRTTTYWCRACYAENYANNRERQIVSNQRARIKRRYGLEWDEYQALLKSGCSVCGSHKRLHVDHCHETGITRGILCSQCNVALGHLESCPIRLRKLADWIESKPAIAQGLPGQAY